MRSAPLIFEAWSRGQGLFFGDRKPTTRIMVQEPWPDLVGSAREYDILRTTSTTGVGNSGGRGLPFRWYQNQANDQQMRELTVWDNISIDKSVDTDAASLSVTIDNQKMWANGAATPGSPASLDELGEPGYYTAVRGDSAEARARWGHEANEWHNLLQPNAVIRVYTGFGGSSGEYPNVLDAVAAGRLLLYGVFLLDEVTPNTSGKLQLSGRDMAKLLIEQKLYPPLVPHEKYPLKYHRWSFKQVPIRASAKAVTTGANTAGVTNGDKRTVYVDSSQDRWYGNDASIYGHRGSHSVDGLTSTYALSVGNNGANRDFSTVWWEYSCNEPMNVVYLHPWQGGYTMYVSIKENGSWQGSSKVPYNPKHILDTQADGVDTGANIPYVASYTVPHETAREFVLPRVYNAERVRISFRNLVYTTLGTWRWRGGIREVRLRGRTSAAGSLGPSRTEGATTTINPPFVMAADARYDPKKIYSQGYLTVSCYFQDDAFGDSRRAAKTGGGTGDEVTCTAVRHSKNLDGYYILDASGNIQCHGNATYYGDPANNDGFTAGNNADGNTWDMALTYTGEGYWVMGSHGQIYGYGDAQDFANVTVNLSTANYCVAMDSHPSDYGVWVLRNDGSVHVRGAASHYGNFGVLRTSPDIDGEIAQCLRSTSTGKGYWTLTNLGRVKAHGDAQFHGQPAQLVDPNTWNNALESFLHVYWELLPAPDDKGYLLLHASGRITAYGNVDYFGSPVPGTKAQLRYDGSYKDYATIAKDLALWSGFLFHSASHPSNQPAPVYGAIETTGAFAKEPLPDTMFDKQPVINALQELREIVGYICFVDDEGRFRFESPNVWKTGNFDENGLHTRVLPVIDERVQLTNYSVSNSDSSLRSDITISSHDPLADFTGTVTTTVIPPTAAKLRGIVRPALWVNDFFLDEDEQRIMAELIALFISFQERIGQVTCIANPAIQINDQVRIYERQTSEVYVHYVRGIQFTHNRISGDYKTTLTTHWLAAGTDTHDIIGGESFPVSPLLQKRIDSGQFGSFAKDPGNGL